MHPVVNHLIQLQELTMIRAEQKAASRKTDLASLDASIEKMTAKLPDDVRSLFTRLEKKDPVVIVPVSISNCAGCAMQLPISLVQAVKSGGQMHQCPACARILYYPDGAPRRIGARTRRSEPRKVGISRFSSAALMVPELKAGDRDEAIHELASVMANEGFIDNEETFAAGAIQRENLLSTSMGHGIAFPHVRGVEGGGIAVAIGISKKGIKFDPSSRNLTRIIFLISIPTAASAFYLKLLAGLTESLTDKDARDSLIAAGTPDKLWTALTKITRSTIK